VQLNPTARDEHYLRAVRELISGQVLGSPGGYPVYLKRWTRMGQARDESLEQLLLLGEPEAVVAVVHAAGLTAEQARRAWWAMPSAENARRMLEKDQVVHSDIGRELAEYLIEYLPFETEPTDIIQSVRLVLQPGLIDHDARLGLWKKGRAKTVYYLGFLNALPDDLPEPMEPRADLDRWNPILTPLADDGNPFARLLLRVLSAPGQSYFRAVTQVMKKPANQDVVNELLDTVAGYFAPLGQGDAPEAELDRIMADADTLCACADTDNQTCPEDLREVLTVAPDLAPEVRAMLVLSRLGFPLVREIFCRSTAIGSLMRRKLEPVFVPLLREIAVLLGQT
jgi:hypothetical protein